MWHKIDREKYCVVLDEPELYVDNKSRGRSGHMSHAMVEFAPDTFIDFNSNCSPVRCKGHSAFGWIEYRISNDAGKTYSEPRELPYSTEALLNGVYTISVEKAVTWKDGRIVAFCLRNDTLHPVCCEPWFTPMVVISYDGGESWSKPHEVSPYKGRIYDALERDGVIYMLQFANDGAVKFTGNKKEDIYKLFVSLDGGESFEERSDIPLDAIGRGYGSLLFDGQGRLHMYAYNINAEREMDHMVSDDLGFSWSSAGACYLEKGIRNPQTALIDGVYILHGRGEKEKGFVLYSSKDGYTWDEGVYLETEKKLCYYSNNIVLNDTDGGKYLLIQYSDAYDEARVNVMHMRLKITK
ncbi:MAG: exo-alpha-sialidase [Clostridia bacterium]|nr:exo-alpha-sialidase [Clostridia bacterium]